MLIAYSCLPTGVCCVPTFAASALLSGNTKKVQGARVESTGVGVIKLAEEMGACVGEVREQGSCDPARRDRTKA